MKVTVDGKDSVCGGLDCDYEYVDTPATCTEFDYSNGQITIGCTGTVPEGCFVSYGNSLFCEDYYTDGSNPIVCSASGRITAGKNVPQINCPLGLLPFTGSEFLDQLTVTSVGDGSKLNPYGGQLIDIVGEGFPEGFYGNNITIRIGSVPCDADTTAATLMQCYVNGFLPENTVQRVLICVNSMCNNQFYLEVGAVPGRILGFSQNPVSPVLRTNFEIELTGLDNPFDASLYDVQFISTKDPKYIRRPLIKGVNATSGRLMIRFLGAVAGTYKIKVSHKIKGMYDNTIAPLLDVNGYIYDIQPAGGSPFGGTIVTITGDCWSNDGLDNNVLVGNVDCIVKSSSKTQIVCETEVRND